MEEQEETKELDVYLQSPKAFHLEMPLYHEFDLSEDGIPEVIHDLLSYSGTLDAHCIWCGKESVFDTDEHLYTDYGQWRWNESGFRRNAFKCSRDRNHKYYVYYLKLGQNAFLKIGQWPSTADFQIPQAEKYRDILGEGQYKEMTRGIGLAAHGVGIGSFVYIRRVFENLIEEAHQLTKKDGGLDEDAYKKARMDEKIELLKNHLPDFLVENKVLYSILSKGIHELTEEECLQYFETVKIGIEQILDEKIIQKEKTEKAARAKESIQNVHGKINGKKYFMKAFLTSHNLKPEHFEAFKKLIGTDRAKKALFITTAAVPYGFDPRPVWLDESLDALRPYVDSIDETTLEDGELIPEDLSQYGFVFVSGGNAFYLAYRFTKTGFGQKLKEYIKNGGVYSGSSAGSIILMDKIEYFAPADDPEKAPEKHAGLGLIDVAVIPHADSEKYKNLMESIAEKYEADGYKTIRLNDDQVLLINGDDKSVI